MIQIEYLAPILTGVGVIVSIVYFTSALRTAEKTQSTSFFTVSNICIMRCVQGAQSDNITLQTHSLSSSPHTLFFTST